MVDEIFTQYVTFMDEELRKIGLTQRVVPIEGPMGIKFFGDHQVGMNRKFFGLIPRFKVVARIVSEPESIRPSKREFTDVMDYKGLRVSIEDKAYKEKIEEVCVRFEETFGQRALVEEAPSRKGYS